MNYTGIIVAACTFAIIGAFHPLVIWVEYHFSKKVWPFFAIVGIVFLFLSLIFQTAILSSIFAVIAASCFWSIRELYQQEQRVSKGWFPRKKRHDTVRSKKNGDL